MTKKILILTSFSIGALHFAQDVSAIRNTTEIYSNTTSIGSAKYTAMAGSMGALGGDISSFNSNPAGLGVFITSDVNASLAITSNQTNSNLAGKSIEKSINNATLGQIGGVLSLQTKDKTPWKFINIGVNFVNENIDNQIQSPGNHNIKGTIIDDQTKKIVDYHLYSGHLYERTGNRSKLNIGIGGNYNNKLYVGAAVNFSSVNVEQHDRALVTLQSNGYSDYFRRNNTPFKEDAGGFSLSIGVIGKINNQLRLGLALESPTWYSIDREYVYYIKNKYSINSYTAVEDRNLQTPGKLTLSGAFIPNKKFAFNIDYKIDLGKPHFSGGDTETQLNDFYKANYRAQNEIRLGGEYRIDRFRVRGGYAFVTSPFKKYTYSSNVYGVFNDDGTVNNNGNLSNYIVGKSQTISGGIGYDFKSFYLDATYQYYTYSYTNPLFDGDYYLPSTSTNIGSSFNSSASTISNVKTKRNSFIITLGWKF